MNIVKLRGVIQDISFSHELKGVSYYKANLIVRRQNAKEDIIELKFKRYSCVYSEGDYITLQGNLRTYLDISKDRSILKHYVFTYFDIPEDFSEDTNNEVLITGIVKRLQPIQTLKDGKELRKFTLTNTIQKETGEIVSSPKCVVFGKLAKEVYLEDGMKVKLRGELHSRSFMSSDDVFVVQHDLYVSSFE